MADRDDRREGPAGLVRWMVGVVAGLAGVAFFVTVFFVGNYWPRKNAARRIRDAGRLVVALLPDAAAVEREHLQGSLDCTVRAVWTDTLPKEEALPLADACLAAIRDGTVSADEIVMLTASADALCRRGGDRPQR